MTLIVQEPRVSDRLIRERREKGLDRQDEVWEGVYLIMPDPNSEHRQLVGELGTVLTTTVDFAGLGTVFAGVNVSNRPPREWKQIYRCPDVAVYLNETAAIDRGTHWFGGPAFAVEIVSPHDRTREKLGFYAAVGTRELLIVDREPWSLELYRLQHGELVLAGRSTPDDPAVVPSEVVPLSLQLVPGDERPQVLLAHADGRQTWTI